MRFPWDCPKWDYELFPNYRPVVRERVKYLLIQLREKNFDFYRNAADTRQIHRHLFETLVWKRLEYYAGHYRGENFRCLRNYNVRIPADSRVGVPAPDVDAAMQAFAVALAPRLAKFDQVYLNPDSSLSEGRKLEFLVAFTCKSFEVFLRIHPFANGNGHIGRFLIWMLLSRFDYWPIGWPIDPKPPDPPYSNLIARYRSGDCIPLEAWITSHIRRSIEPK